MDIFLNTVIGVMEEGLMYALLAMGMYITYSILDFPDLSVDGTFPQGRWAPHWDRRWAPCSRACSFCTELIRGCVC